MRKTWIARALLFFAGIGITLFGFVYDIMFAGIPYQDAPTRLQSSYALHSRIASGLEVSGLCVAFAAMLIAMIHYLRRPRARLQD
jgi:hypothetical protein